MRASTQPSNKVLNESIDMGDETETIAYGDFNGDETSNKKLEQGAGWLSDPVYMQDAPDPEMVMIDMRKQPQ